MLLTTSPLHPVNTGTSCPVHRACGWHLMQRCTLSTRTHAQHHSITSELKSNPNSRPPCPCTRNLTIALYPEPTPCTVVTQVQGLPGALPAQLVRPTAGSVTWLLDSDSAASIGAERWTEEPKAFPRRSAPGPT